MEGAPAARRAAAGWLGWFGTSARWPTLVRAEHTRAHAATLPQHAAARPGLPGPHLCPSCEPTALEGCRGRIPLRCPSRKDQQSVLAWVLSHT